MTPFYTDDWLTLYGGDCRAVLASLPADSVDCVVTSPPYWGLRDYGSDGQLGLERTPEEYVANLVAVFAEVRRVLKPSGTCWLNLGDSYASDQKGSGGDGTRSGLRRDGRPEASRIGSARKSIANQTFGTTRIQHGLKPKDLVGIPWRVAFALQADGWYLRSDIIWSKPNPMPESVTDRPTKAHEYLFLLTKSARYYFDADAVRETVAREWDDSIGGSLGGTKRLAGAHIGGDTREQRPVAKMNPAGRNIRSVWTIATRPYPGAHFAVFPPELPERCIKAGSSEYGVCGMCGAPWERVVERTSIPPSYRPTNKPETSHAVHGESTRTLAQVPVVTTTGWRPTCHTTDSLDHTHPIPAVILDPFAGSGTVGMVANRLSRRAILIDLNPEYLVQQMKRNAQTPLGLTEGDAA